MSEENFLSGHKFAKIADYIFATVIESNGQKKHVLYPLNVNLLDFGISLKDCYCSYI